MLPVLSAQQMRDYDRYATEVHGVPSIELMENAGRGAAERVAALLGVDMSSPSAAGPSAPERVIVVAGAGNNAGDGFVVARRLIGVGVRVKTFLALPADKLKGDALANYELLVESGASIVQLADSTTPLVQALDSASVVVDALFGTGLDREIGGFLAQLIDAINAARCQKLALDLPSGLHADTGRVLGTCVKADFTVTFAHRKLGLCTPRGAAQSGELTLVDIVKPADPSATGVAAQLLEAADVAKLVMPRGSTAHKSSAGRVLVVAGSPGKLGAALLAARGAQRAGAGLVTIATTPASADALDARVLEAMTARLDAATPEDSLKKLLEPAGAVVVGPGLGLDAEARRLVDAVVFGFPGPKVVDADALSHFSGRAAELTAAKNVVLTPHSGELGRLLGIPYTDVDDDRFGAVARAVELTGAVVLLKGRYSVIGAPGVLPVVNPTGGPALATGGSGDVLSGIIAALCCELPTHEAAFVGAFVHGAAADSWSRARGGADRGLLAHEIADALPAVMAPRP